MHLLHYIPERRGRAFDVIEDVIPIRRVGLSVRAPRRVRAVATAPDGAALKFSQRHGRVERVLPELRGHQMISLTFCD